MVLSGPSGVGKGTVVAALRRLRPDIWVSVSWTTRPPRPEESDGIDYVFVEDATFASAVDGGEFLEHASYAGHSYGTPRTPVEQRLRNGVPVVLEIDLQGARQVKAAMADALLVFLAPPSWGELEHRLSGRGTEDPELLARRLAIARQELAHEEEFDAVIVNETVEDAAQRLVTLISASIAN